MEAEMILALTQIEQLAQIKGYHMTVVGIAIALIIVAFLLGIAIGKWK